MDKLGVFFKSLSLGERQGFRHYLKVKSNGKDSKRVFLFELLMRNKSSEQMKKILQDRFDTTENAYYQLKRALVIELEKFIIQNRSDIDHRSEVYHKLELAQHFTDNVRYELAWSYLKEAEEIAEVNGFFEILPAIYFFEMQVANKVPSYRRYVPVIVEKRKEMAGWLSEVTSWLGSLNGESSVDQSTLNLRPREKRKGEAINSAEAYRQLEWITSLRIQNRVSFSNFRTIALECLKVGVAEDVSAHNKLHWYLVEAIFYWQSRDVEKCQSALDKLEAMLKTGEQVPLGLILEWYRIKVELLVFTGKFQEAFQRSERVFKKYAELLPDDQYILTLYMLVNVCFKCNRMEEALYYIRLLEAKKEVFINYHGQNGFNKLQLLKAAFLGELCRDDEFFKTIAQIEKGVSLPMFRNGIEILRAWFQSREFSSSDNQKLEQLCVEFLAEYPGNSSDYRVPEFSDWVKSKCEEVQIGFLTGRLEMALPLLN